MKFNTFIKIYLWIVGALLLTMLAFELTDDEPSDLTDYLDYIFWIIALMGVWGYCYSKKIFTNLFWKYYLPFIVLWDFFIIFIEVSDEPELQDPAFLVFLLLIYLIILIPEYTAIYLYGYTIKMPNKAN